MAVRIGNPPFDSTGTNIRLWAQFVEDVLVSTGGWAIAGDTGQTLPSALPAPTGGGSIPIGYRIYSMTDGITPVFMRVDFGSGSAFQYTPPPYPPSFWITIGTGSSGTGTITGVMLPILQSRHTTASAANTNNSYGSADRGRCAISLWSGALGFSIERTVDEAGVITSDGLLFTSSNLYGDSGGVHIGLGNSAFLMPNTARAPVDSGLHYYHTTTDPAPIINGNKGVGVLFHFYGTAQQPGINWIVVNSTDIGAESQIRVNIYGVWHLYQAVGMIPLVGVIAAQPSAQTSIVLDQFRRTMMRWE